jgi:hypothetical protein
MSESDIGIEFGTNVDRLITADIRGRAVISKLYMAALERFGKPLSYVASRALIDKVHRGDTVIITTGHPVRPWVNPEIMESDGPPGAVALAKAINMGLGAVPVIVCEDSLTNIVHGGCSAAGILVRSVEEAKKSTECPHFVNVASIRALSVEDHDTARETAHKILNELNPVAMIAIEKPGMNEKGIYHLTAGFDISPGVAKVDYIFEEARSQGILTIGVGDGGNELGMGVIKDFIKASIPNGSECKCPCKAGIAPYLETDFLVVSTVSNWGAYAIVACLAYILENPSLLHDAETELRVLNQCAFEGAIDSVGRAIPQVDSIPANIHCAIVESLRYLTNQWIKRKKI